MVIILYGLAPRIRLDSIYEKYGYIKGIAFRLNDPMGNDDNVL
jgi:hypothetical protein